MKIFITGKNGFIAQHLIARCLKDNHQVESSSQLDDLECLLNNFKPDIICHLAAELTNEDKMVSSNILLTHTILEYCRKNHVDKFILFGSSSEYGRKESPLKETDFLEPETMYEGTKAAATLLSRVYSYTYNINTVVIRPLSVYGPLEKPNKLITLLLSEKLKVMNNGYHDWIYIDDFIEATMCILYHKSTLKFDIVNIGLGVQRSNQDVHRIAESILGRRIDYESTANNLGGGVDSVNWVCDNTHLVTEYGFKPKITLEDGMKKFYQHLR
jgi:nucleoside-diphosphate-sugar epimerase